MIRDILFAHLAVKTAQTHQNKIITKGKMYENHPDVASDRHNNFRMQETLTSHMHIWFCCCSTLHEVFKSPPVFRKTSGRVPQAKQMHTTSGLHNKKKERIKAL